MKTLFQCFVAVVVLFFSTLANAGLNDTTVSVFNWRTKKEIVMPIRALEIFRAVRKTAKQYNIDPEVLQAMTWQETRAGTGGSVGSPHRSYLNRSYGVMQVEIPTARDMFRRDQVLLERYFPGRDVQSIKHKEIADLLLKNDEANIDIGVAVFALYYEMTGRDLNRTIAAYNMGIGHALKRKEAPKAAYVREVHLNLKHIVVPVNIALDAIEQEEQLAKEPESSPIIANDVESCSDSADSCADLFEKENNNVKQTSDLERTTGEIQSASW